MVLEMVIQEYSSLFTPHIWGVGGGFVTLNILDRLGKYLGKREVFKTP